MLFADAKACVGGDSRSLASAALALHRDHSTVGREERTRERKESVEPNRASDHDARASRERRADGLRTLLAYVGVLERNLADRIAEKVCPAPA